MKPIHVLMILWWACGLCVPVNARQFQAKESRFLTEAVKAERVAPGQVGQRLDIDPMLFDQATRLGESGLSAGGAWVKQNVSLSRPILDSEANHLSRVVMKNLLEAPDRVNMTKQVPEFGGLLVVQSESVRQAALFVNGKAFVGFGNVGKVVAKEGVLAGGARPLEAATQKALPAPAKLQQLEYTPGRKLAIDVKGPSLAEIGTTAQKRGIMIANENAIIPKEEIPNFIGMPERTLVGEGELLYGIRDPGSKNVWWSRQKPRGELQWRLDQAVLNEWNDATHIEVLRVPKGGGLIGFEGAARDQRGFIGGGNQIYIPKVPKEWRRMEEWK